MIAPLRPLSRRRSARLALVLFSAALTVAAASPARAGDAPTRAVPTAFIDAKPNRPCIEQALEQQLDAPRALKAAAHACMKGRFAAFKQAHPEWFPVEGKPVVNRPK